MPPHAGSRPKRSVRSPMGVAGPTELSHRQACQGRCAGGMWGQTPGQENLPVHVTMASAAPTAVVDPPCPQTLTFRMDVTRRGSNLPGKSGSRGPSPPFAQGPGPRVRPQGQTAGTGWKPIHAGFPGEVYGNLCSPPWKLGPGQQSTWAETTGQQSLRELPSGTEKNPGLQAGHQSWACSNPALNMPRPPLRPPRSPHSPAQSTMSHTHKSRPGCPPVVLHLLHGFEECLSIVL